MSRPRELREERVQDPLRADPAAEQRPRIPRARRGKRVAAVCARGVQQGGFCFCFVFFVFVLFLFCFCFVLVRLVCFVLAFVLVWFLLVPFGSLSLSSHSHTHARSSPPQVPSSRDLFVDARMPFGMVIQPFARVGAGDMPSAVPAVDFAGGGAAAAAAAAAAGYSRNGLGDGSGPPRCGRCRAYVSPFARWLANGNKWKCALCGMCGVG